MSAIDQRARRPILADAANMKGKISKFKSRPGQRYAWIAVVVLAGALAWPVIHHVRMHRALPIRPDLSSSPSILVNEITSAESAARGWGFSDAGLKRLAGLYHANGFFDEALACYRILAESNPHEARWPHLIANIESSFGRIAEALPWQRKAAELAPGNFIVHLRLGDLLFKDNAIEEARKSYERAQKLEPTNPYVLQGLARCAMRQDDWTGARAYLHLALKARGDFVSGWALLTDVETHLGNLAVAEQSRRLGNGQFREMIDPWLSDLNDLRYDPYQLSIAAASLTTDPARARQLLERAVAISPQSSAYRRQLAKMLIAAHETKAAREHLEKAVALDPDDAESWSTLIALLLDLHDGHAAFTAVQEGLRHCPQSGYLHFIKGQALAATAHPDQAEEEFKLSQRLQPAEIRAYIELTSLYVQAGRVPEAIDEAQGALAADPGNTTVMGMLAQLYIMQRNEAEAIQWTRKVRANPGDQSAILQQIQSMYLQQFSHPLSD